MMAEIRERRIAWEAVAYALRNGLRENDLIPVTRVADPARAMDLLAGVVVPMWDSLACVDADADPDTTVLGPRIRRERALSLDCSSDRVGFACEDGEERVAVRPDLPSRVLREHPPQD